MGVVWFVVTAVGVGGLILQCRFGKLSLSREIIVARTCKRFYILHLPLYMIPQPQL